MSAQEPFADGTGKSTLRLTLGPAIGGLQHFDYGESLRSQKAKLGSVVTCEQLREESASVISRQDVADMDAKVIAEISGLRKSSDVIIDPHALTREEYGLRAIPFSSGHLIDGPFRFLLEDVLDFGPAAGDEAKHC